MNQTSHTSRPGPLENLGLLLLFVVVLVAPYPYGGIRPGGTFTIQALSYLTGIATLVAVRNDASMRLPWLPAVLIGGIALLGFLQTAPLPSALLSRLSPMSLEIYREAATLLREYGREVPAPRISLSPWDTRQTAFTAGGHAVLLLASAALFRTRSRRRVLQVVILLAALAQVVYSVASSPPGLQRLHGSFVNPNHLGGYLEVGLSVAFSLLWLALRPNRGRTRNGELAASVEKRLLPVAGAVLLWGTLLSGIGLSRSRGALLASLAATAVMVFLAIAHGLPDTRRRVAASIGGGLFAALAFAAFTAGSRALLRFLETDLESFGTEGRVQIWRGAIEAARAFPWLGSGLGTFREAFRMVQRTELNGLVEQAHSEPLQILVTGGLVGFALAAAAAVAVLRLLLQDLFSPGRREDSAFVLAATGAVISLMLHGLAEFNFSLPSIPATLAILVGAACSATETRSMTPASPARV